MKTFTQFLLLFSFWVFCASSNLAAQSFEQSWQNHLLSTAHVVAYSEFDDTWIVGGQTGNFSQTRPDYYDYLRKIDANGNVLWEVNQLTNVEQGMIKEILPLLNGEILIIGEESLCDVLDAGTYLIKLSVEGEVIWEAEHPWGDRYYFTKLQLTDDNQLIALQLKQISLLDLDGNFIWTYPFDFDYNNIYASSLSILSNGNLLVGGTNFLNVYSAENGALLVHQEYEEGIMDIVSYSFKNEYFVLTGNNQVINMNENLTIIETEDLSSFFDETTHFTKLNNNTIAILGEQQNDSRVLILDESFAILNNIYIEHNQYTITSIATSPESLGIVGFIPSHSLISGTLNWQYSSFSSFMQVLPILETPSTSNIDIGVESISYSSADLLDSGTCLGEFFPVKSIYLKDVQVTLKNYGTEPIEEVKVNLKSFDTCSRYCGQYFTIFEELNGLNISSENTYTVSLGDMIIGKKWVSDSYDICFWTSVPNNQIDADNFNNMLCETLVFNDIKSQPPLSSLQLYPNPTQDTFTISLAERPSNSLQLELLNPQGQIIFQADFRQSLEVDLSDYPTGIYMVKVSDGQENTIKKVVHY